MQDALATAFDIMQASRNWLFIFSFLNYEIQSFVVCVECIFVVDVCVNG